jgi:hypothetical protein
MRKPRRRISVAVISLVALFFSLAGFASASQPASSGVIRAAQETTHYTFYARPRKTETECEPTTAKALRLDGHRVPLPTHLTNRSHTGTVHVYERDHGTCVSIVSTAPKRLIVHFSLVFLDTTTRLR